MGHRDWIKEEYSKFYKNIDWKQLDLLRSMYEAGFYDGMQCNREYDPLWDSD